MNPMILPEPGSICRAAPTPELERMLETTAARHARLCPRQVLGVQMARLAGQVLGLALPQSDKRLYAIVETDGCTVDGIAVAANCWPGRRTMRIEDYGKVAATFVDTHTGRVARLAARPGIRERARAFAPEVLDPWQAMLRGYQRMRPAELFTVQAVTLRLSPEDLRGAPGRRSTCARCGEEIMNAREVEVAGEIVCRACAGEAYYVSPGR